MQVRAAASEDDASDLSQRQCTVALFCPRAPLPTPLCWLLCPTVPRAALLTDRLHRGGGCLGGSLHGGEEMKGECEGASEPLTSSLAL